MESTQYLRNQLLRDADWASMAHSLELRVPLVDPILYRAFSDAHFEPVRSEGKGAMIRRAAPELPPQVFERAKSGFMVPWAGSPRPSASGSGRWGHQARLLGLEVLKAFGVELGDLPDKRPRRGGTLFLLPEAFRGDGGIQTYNRAQVQAVLRNGSAEPVSALVLNDSPVDVRQPEWRSIRGRGFGRRHVRFAAASLLTAAHQQPQRTIIAHRNFLPLAPLVAMAAPGRQRWLLTYGIEAQRPLHLLERGLLRWIDRVFAISPQTAEAFKLAGYRRPVDLWPCSLPFSWTFPEPHPPRFESPVRLLSVSRLAPPERYKGIDVTISAVGLLKRRGHEVVFDVVGEGRDLERLQTLCREGGLEDSVHFHGRVTSDRLRDLYALSDIFVLPSGAEGFGIVYLEALAFAKPVIAADAGGAPFVVRPGASGVLVNYGDAAGLARSIETLIDDPDAARALGSRGRAFLERNFSFEHMVRRTRSLFGEVGTPADDSELVAPATTRERQSQSIGPV
jgi:glycosyltransferase involved in cell wall biosynthesis